MQREGGGRAREREAHAVLTFTDGFNPGKQEGAKWAGERTTWMGKAHARGVVYLEDDHQGHAPFGPIRGRVGLEVEDGVVVNDLEHVAAVEDTPVDVLHRAHRQQPHLALERAVALATEHPVEVRSQDNAQAFPPGEAAGTTGMSQCLAPRAARISTTTAPPHPAHSLKPTLITTAASSPPPPPLQLTKSEPSK